MADLRPPKSAVGLTALTYFGQTDTVDVFLIGYFFGGERWWRGSVGGGNTSGKETPVSRRPGPLLDAASTGPNTANFYTVFFIRTEQCNSLCCI